MNIWYALPKQAKRLDYDDALRTVVYSVLHSTVTVLQSSWRAGPTINAIITFRITVYQLYYVGASTTMTLCASL